MSKYNNHNEYVQAMLDGEGEKIEAFMNSENAIGIFQLGFKDGTNDIMFEPYDRLSERGLQPERRNYVMVYSCEEDKDFVSDNCCLECIWERFNLARPQDFEGHSLSVSDVVVLKNGDVVSAYYVDSFGFKRIEIFSVVPRTVSITIADTKLKALAKATGTVITTEKTLRTAVEYAIDKFIAGQVDLDFLTNHAKGKA